MLGVVGRDSKGQRIHKNDKIPEWDEMGVELDDGTDGIPLVTRFDEGLSCDGTWTTSGGLQLANGLASFCFAIIIAGSLRDWVQRFLTWGGLRPPHTPDTYTHVWKTKNQVIKCGDDQQVVKRERGRSKGQNGMGERGGDVPSPQPPPRDRVVDMDKKHQHIKTFGTTKRGGMFPPPQPPSR